MNIINGYYEQYFAFFNFIKEDIELLQKIILKTQTQTKNEIHSRNLIEKLTIKNAYRDCCEPV